MGRGNLNHDNTSEPPSYLWLLNNDTIVHPDSLKEMVFQAQSNPTIGLLGPTILYYNTPDKIQTLGGGTINPILGTSRHVTSNKNSASSFLNFPPHRWGRLGGGDSSLSYIHGASIFARVDMINKIGLLDERFFIYWEDTDLSYRAKKSGWLLTHAPQARIWHKEGGSIGKQSPFADYHHARSACIFFRKHYGLSWIITLAIMFCGKLTKRILRGQFTRINLLLKALISGISHPLH
ncbi:glycosyltransferase family 2 protein [Elusimicrobiota bacterium]